MNERYMFAIPVDENLDFKEAWNELTYRRRNWQSSPRRQLANMDKKLAAVVTEYSEELESVRLMNSRKPYLLAMMMRDIKDGRVDVTEVEEVESALVSLGFYSEDEEPIVEELRKIAEKIPEDDPDAEGEVVEEIKSAHSKEEDS